MALFITSLNSGSNGNCYYVGNEREAVLIDAGISCRETEKRMRLLGLSMNMVKAIFISHEHTDHIKGLPVLAAKYALPVFITKPTLLNGGLFVQANLVNSFMANEPVNIGGLSVTAFPKAHDAADPHSFMVSGNGINVGVFTDIGICCQNVIKHFKKCHAAFLEANYDEALLENGSYPYFLKNRIRGGKGHLSNTQALEIFNLHRPKYMSHLLLSHLSRDNNDPQLVKTLFTANAGSTAIIVAGRYAQTDVFTITKNGEAVKNNTVKKVAAKDIQLQLF